MCDIVLSAQKAGCKTVGGATDIWLIDKQQREAAGVTYVVTDGAVVIAGTGGQAFHLIPRQNNITVTQARTDDNVQGTSFVTQALEFNLHGYDASKAYLHEQVAKGRTEALVLWADGTYVLMGIEMNGLQSNGGDGGFTGTNRGDANGQTYVLNCESTLLAPIASFTEFEAAFDITEPA